METLFTTEKISPQAGIELGPLDQKASALPTELPGLLQHTMDRCLIKSLLMIMK